MSLDFAAVGRGFTVPALGSQAVFRCALEALSRPGRVIEIESDAEVPAGMDAASCALALALLDQDTSLWRSPALGRTHIGNYFRFHTGCVLAARPENADFALVKGGELPALEAFPAGSDEYPDRSATLVVLADVLSEGGGWALRGPGIKGVARIACGGLPEDFVAQWNVSAARYPRGVDAFIACGRLVCGLPRTTRIEA